MLLVLIPQYALLGHLRVNLRVRRQHIPVSSFAWPKSLRWEGAPANRATQLEGLTHSPPLHATHLTGTVSGLRGLSFERPLSTTNKMADQRNFLAASLKVFIAHSASGLFSVYRTVVLHSTDSL